MKQSSLTIFFAALMTALFSACSDDFGSKDIPQEELYTRAFIKEFGVFDMAHTWNLATEGTITVTPISYINECKVYARYEGEYYYVARAINAYKEFTLTFDIPSGVTDLKLLIDGTTYYAQVGTRLQASGRGSRTAYDDKNADDAVEIIGLTTTPNDGWEEYSDEYAISYRNTVPEGWDNRFKDEITQDFLFTSNLDDQGEPVVTTLYPVYWQTSQTHTIGVYYYPNNDETQTMVTVPLYTSKSGTTQNETGDIQYRQLQASSTVTVKSTDEWVLTELGVSSINFTTSDITEETSDKTKLTLTDDQQQTLFAYVKDHNKAVYSSIEYDTQKVYFKSVKHTDDYDILTLICKGGPWSEWTYVNGLTDSYLGEGTQYRSKGIQFTVDAGIYFGMYSSSGAVTFYSQRHLNEPKYCEDHGYNPPGGTGNYADIIDNNGASHAATFYGEYTNWLYLCFEDWYESQYSDMDLNDMVCRLTPTTLTTKTTTEIELENKSFTWLIAAEDLGTTDDFDFNDMVVAVSSLPTTDVGNENASFSIVQFTALAAGGTLPLYLHLVGKPLYTREGGSSTNVSSCTRGTLSDGVTTDYVLYPDNKDASSAEWHKWFGNGEYSSSTMINTTSAGYTVSGMTSTVYLQGTYTITQYGYVDTEDNNTIKGFCISVNGEDLKEANKDASSLTQTQRYNLTPAEKGTAPQMFVILDQGDPSDNTKGWRWPIERHDIMDAYQYFQPWAADHNTNQNWHTDPTGSEVIAARSTTHKTTYTGSIPGGGGGGGGNTPVDPTPSKVSYEDLSITKVWDRACDAVYSLTFSTSDWDACSGIKVNNPGDYDLYKDSNFYNKIKTIYSNTTKFGKGDDSATSGVTIGNSMPSAVDGYYTVYLVDWGGTFSSVDLYTE